MSCPQVRTAPLFPSSGKPGLVLYGTSSSRKRLIRQEDNDELLPKKARPTSELSPLCSRLASKPSFVAPKIECSHLEFPYRDAELHQILPNVPPPCSETSLKIKCEGDSFVADSGLARTSNSFRPPDQIEQNMNWVPEDDSYVSLFTGHSGLQRPTIVSHTSYVPPNFLTPRENNANQGYQPGLSTSSSLWPTELDNSHPQYWPLPGPLLDEWSATTQVDSLHSAEYGPVYDAHGGESSYVYSGHIVTLPDQSPVTFDSLDKSLVTGTSCLQHHLHKSFMPQSIQKPEFVESTLPHRSHDFFVPPELNTRPDSTGAHCEYLDEVPSSVSLQQWHSPNPPHGTFTGNQDPAFVPQELTISPQWSHGPLRTTADLQQGLQKDPPVSIAATIKSESHVEEGLSAQLTAAQTQYDSNVVKVQATFDFEQPLPSFHGLPSHHHSLNSAPEWPIYPDHDPDLLFACQSSRQVPQEIATGMLDPKGNLKMKKHLPEEERQQTSRTRDIGACVRCKMQRVRCRPNPADPNGPCIPCLKVASNPSKKVIHHIGCHRYKLQEITIFRTSPTPVNPKRWQTAQVRDVITYGEPIFVKLKQHFGKPFMIRVSAFIPLEDDETSRAGRNSITGEEYNEPLGLFALKRAHDVIDDYRTYIKKNWHREFTEKCATPGDMQSEVDVLIADVYNLSLRHLNSLPNSPSWDMYRSAADWDPRKVSQQNFMQGTLMMCFVLRQALGQSWIDPDGLDPEQWPRHKKFTPLKGLPGTPRMIVSQLDCIRISCVLRPLAKPLLKVLTTWIAERRHDCWLSIFYASFIFLREIALATQDAYDHGRRKKSYDPKDPKPNHHSIIAEMHESANVVLAHWHYFNCSINLETLDEKARSKSPLKGLTSEQFETVRGLWVRMRLWKAGRPQCDNRNEYQHSMFKNDMGFVWCHPLYFAAQMFEPSWSPLKVFTG